MLLGFTGYVLVDAGRQESGLKIRVPILVSTEKGKKRGKKRGNEADRKCERDGERLMALSTDRE